MNMTLLAKLQGFHTLVNYWKVREMKLVIDRVRKIRPTETYLIKNSAIEFKYKHLSHIIIFIFSVFLYYIHVPLVIVLKIPLNFCLFLWHIILTDMA